MAHRGDFDLRSHMEGKLVRQGDQLVVETDADGKPRHRGSGKDLSYFDDHDEGAVHAARDRAFGRRRSGHAGVPLRGLQRGRSARRERQADQAACS